MQTKTKAAAVAVGAMVALWPLTVAAAQMRASESPSVSGPLSLHEEHCFRQDKKRHSHIVVTAKVCLRVYFLKASNDNDAAYNHGAVWVQTSLHAAKGWCVTKVVPSSAISSNTIVDNSRTPARTIKPPDKKTVRARVVVDADGAAPTSGYVRQTFLLFPDVLRRAHLTTLSNNDRELTELWKGSSRRRLAFVVGAEISFRPNNNPTITAALDYDAVKAKRC
ncbi:MAG: hypothetical protein M3290_02470 [Actinomycetota bacterium]|nr:hypothetical protein [Actinomycetota bacterium]